MIIDMDQNSQSWHDYRRTGIGASDMPIIMGISPWKTPLDLWRQKVGLEPPSEETMVTLRGHQMEPIARQHYELETGIEVQPTFFQSDKYPILRASLDGYSRAKNVAVEIKCPGKDTHALAQSGEVPAYYMPQLQQQLLCSGADVCHYYSFDGEDGHLIEVAPNELMQAEIIDAGLKFWDLVEKRKQPSLTERDYLIETDPYFVNLVNKYKIYKEMADQLADKMSNIKAGLVEHMRHNKVECDGLIMYQSKRKGSIDYKKVPQLQDIDLEQFRKEGSESFTIREKK